MPQHPPLPCSQIVYRTITRAGDLGDGEALASAFHRRDNDKKGLSVDFCVDVPDGCASQLTGKKAVVALHVGKLRELGLDVIPDSDTHANIVEVPFYSDLDQRELAEQFAIEMAGMARTVWRK